MVCLEFQLEREKDRTTQFHLGRARDNEKACLFETHSNWSRRWLRGLALIGLLAEPET